jgi:hypothetical protein
MPQSRARRADPAILDDAELVSCALARDPDAFRGIMQRHNQRLYRIARSVLRNSTDADASPRTRRSVLRRRSDELCQKRTTTPP